jgi:hypothetical protein
MSTQIRGNKQIKNITIQNSQIADGTIELDKLKDGSELIKRDGSVAVTGDFDFGSHQIKNLAAPVDDNDAVRKADLDAVIGGSIVTREIPVGATNGSNTQFTLANVPNIGTEQVFLNGALLNAGANSDYVIENDTITFTIPPQAGDAILVNYISDMIVVSLDINTSINQLNSRLTTAEGELFTAQNDITSLDSDLSGVDSRLTSAEADIVAVEGDVATLQSSLSSVQSSVSSLTSDLSDEQAARIAADDALDTTVSSVQTSVTSLGNRMTAAESDITALEAADAAFDLRAGVIEDGLQAETNARTSADSALSSRVTALENAPDPVTSLSALSDVTITSPSADQILKYNGTGWVNGAAPSTFSGSYNDLTNKPTIPSVLDDLSDVTITSLASGQFVRWDGTAWKNYTIPNAGMGVTGLVTFAPQTIDGEKFFYKKSHFREYINGFDGGTLFVKTDLDAIALVVKGNSTQTAKLFQVQNSSGTELFSIDKDGSVAAGTVPVARVSGLATVATSGSYNDLTNKPTIPSLTEVEADIADHETRIVDIESTAFVTREVPSGSVNGSNAVFTLANTPVAGTEQVFLNGLLQQEGVGNDYTISGDTITFTTAPDSGWKLFVNYATGNYVVSPGGPAVASGSSVEIYQDSEFNWVSGFFTTRTLTHNKGRFPDMVVVFTKYGEGWVRYHDNMFAGGANYGWDEGSNQSTVNAHKVRLFHHEFGSTPLPTRIRLYWFSNTDVATASAGWVTE